MNNYWLTTILSGLALVVALLVLTYQRLSKHKRLVRIQSNEIERQLHELKNQNEIQLQLNFEKQQAIRVVSHDLKGPFNRIFALVQLMDMSGSLSDDQKEYLGKIHQITVDGLNMVRNLLDNRKLEDKRMEMVPEELNLSAITHSLIKSYRTLAAKKNIALLFEAPEEIKIFSDRNFITRILENLLSNAIKFSPPEKTVFIIINEKQDQWIVNIRDEGPGISAEDQKKLFQKFQPLSARPTGGESSTGLGLWIVKSLIEKAGGEVTCYSAVGVGTTFEARFKKL